MAAGASADRVAPGGEAGPARFGGYHTNLMDEPVVLFNARALDKALLRIAHEISEHNETTNEVVLIGIQKGGIHLAGRLAKLLESIWQHPVLHGTLDVGMHRDDVHEQIVTMQPTELPFDLTGKTAVLVDDVLFSGRTIRSALSALNDFGRPKRVQLAVLVDRGHRELPIKADFVGKNVPTSLHERIDVRLREQGGDDAVYIVQQ